MLRHPYFESLSAVVVLYLSYSCILYLDLTTSTALSICVGIVPTAALSLDINVLFIVFCGHNFINRLVQGDREVTHHHS